MRSGEGIDLDAAPPEAPVNAAPPVVNPNDLRRVPLLADLPSDDLAWIARECERVDLEPGEICFASGEAAEWMYFGLEGILQARLDHLAPGAPAFVVSPGDIGGVVPFSRMRTFLGTGRAITRASVARFPKGRFGALLARVPVLTERFVWHLLDRVRDATRRDAQFEKLMALGKLSAGLAHELNNPGAAVLNGAHEGERRLAERAELTAALLAWGVTPDAVRRLERMRAAATGAEPRGVDAITRVDLADTLGAWLAELDVPDPWVSAATFVDAGIDRTMLEGALDGVPREGWRSAIAWLESALADQALFGATRRAAGRIAQIVQAMRAYTNRDRMRDMTDVDIREGLDATLDVCTARYVQKTVEIVRRYDPALPRMRAYPGDLNQAWEALIDNALDAAPAQDGRVEIRAVAREGAIAVDVCDNGPGIPEEIQSRVWEPFFTTKDVGRGTGLGLDIARRIIVDLHGGQLELASTPGSTTFTARLPLASIGTFGA